jgi:hypothetical protein
VAVAASLPSFIKWRNDSVKETGQDGQLVGVQRCQQCVFATNEIGQRFVHTFATGWRYSDAH